MSPPGDNEQHPLQEGAPSAGLDQKPGFGNESNNQAEAERIHGVALGISELFHIFPLDHPTHEWCQGVGKDHKAHREGDRGKHPACKWSQWATQDPEHIGRYFRGRPLNIGIDCGRSRLLVVDEDVLGEWERLCEHLGIEPPRTFTVRTAQGRHFYFHQPPGAALGNAEGALRGFKVNVRGAGGYVVGPGSLHETGIIYEVVEDVEVAEVPGRLVDALRSKSGPAGRHGLRVSSDGRTWATVNDGAPKDHTWWRKGSIAEGNRHHAIVAAAGWCLEMGITEAEGEPFIRDVWSRCVGDKYTWDDALARRDDVYGRYEAGDQLAQRRGEAGNGGGLTLTTASAIKVDRPHWVWDRRIPVGGTTLMAGREGMGKTAFVCWIGGRLTQGKLPGQWEGRPADLVYIGHEDDRATVLVPRLIAAGANLDRFHFVDLDRAFTVAEDVDPLAQTLRGRPVALVVVDPLDAHLGAAIDSNRDKAKIQATIGNLARLTQELRCGALGLGHLNKAAITDLLAKVVGSVGFTTSVRSVLAIGEHPDAQDEKVCVVAKANMTDKAMVPATRFKIEGHTVAHPDDALGIDTGRVVILGEQLGINPNALLVGDSETRSKIDEATDWVNDMLSGGPMKYPDIERAATARGISRATLHRARERLGGVAIEPVKTSQGQSSSWRLTPSGVRLKAVETNPLETNPNVPSTRDDAPDEGGSSQLPDIETNPPDGQYSEALALLERAFGPSEIINPEETP